jgi:hypothetical protein
MDSVAKIPEDRIRSPYTGWTREHWAAVADGTLASVRRYASPNHGLIRLPGPESVSGSWSDGLEGFARTFLAAGFRLAGGGGGDLAEWYARGIAAGVDPASPERWPAVDAVPQAKVEAASIALALHESRTVLWQALPDRVQAQLVDWLAGVIGQPYPACNWLWFQSIVEAFLRSVGGPWSAEDLERNEAAIETWYLADGWYTDGLSGVDTARNFDWYAGWAMHVYPLWYGRITGTLDEGHRERLRRYLDGARHLYAPDGPPLHQGRSLTYRYAALAPVWAGAIFDATPLGPGETRRLASGTLRHFLCAGLAEPQPIGWYSAFEPIRQPYSGPGSPYWSSKGLAGLVLRPDHPVWTDIEEPLPVERADVGLALPVPGWLVSATRADGVVRVVNHGTDHADARAPTADDPGYARFAYATHAGPEYGADARRSPLDNHVALVDAHGMAAHRSPLVPLGVRGRIGLSRYRAHWPAGRMPDRGVWPPRQPSFEAGPWVTTASVLRGAIEIRVARVDPDDADVHGGPWWLRIGGYAVAADRPPEARTVGSWADSWREDGLRSAVVGLHGLPNARVHHSEATNAYGRYSAVPAVCTTDPVVPGRVYAAAVILTRNAEVTLPQLAVAHSPVARITVWWPDGEVDQVHLDDFSGSPRGVGPAGPERSQATG